MQKYFPFIVLLAVTSAFLGSCSSSTDPGGGGSSELTYSPDRQFLDVEIPNTADFSVSAGSGNLSATWRVNGQEMGTGLSYEYQSGAVGLDTVTVATVLNGTNRQRDWLVTVQPSASLLPPPVTDISIQNGDEPMDVVVSWVWINQSAFPVTEYLIASSYDGPVTSDNWDEADFLGAYAHVNGQAGYSTTFTAEDDGMLPATTIWFGLRGRDNRGQMSPIVEIYRHTISFAWWIEGTVYDSNLDPLPEVIIDYGCGSCRVNSDGEGHYQIGPFLDVEEVNFYTLSRNVDFPGQPLTSWYDLEVGPLVYSEVDNTHDIYLINRFGTDDLCLTYDDDFLAFFRQMTKTDITTALRADYRLYKWDEYPVKVHIPEYVRPDDDVDFGENSRLGMSYWNLVMGEDYLVEVATPEEADVLFFFEDLGSGANGRTELAAPQLPYFYRLSDVIPERINVRINNDILPNDQRVQETALHELGHALGLYQHVDGCSDRPYLMNITSAGALDDGPENAVHLDEIRMLHAIRYLPQGIDMASFINE